MLPAQLSVFIAMGGDRRDIDLVFLDSEWDERHLNAEAPAALAALQVVHVASAECGAEGDRARLISTVEAGFGTLDAFDEQMRALLMEAARARQDVAGILRIPGMGFADGSIRSNVPPNRADHCPAMPL